MDLTMYFLDKWARQREAKKGAVQETGLAQLGHILKGSKIPMGAPGSPVQEPIIPGGGYQGASPLGGPGGGQTATNWPQLPGASMNPMQQVLGLPSQARGIGLDILQERRKPKSKPSIHISGLHKGKKGFFRNVFHDGVLHHTETGLPGPKEKPQLVSMSKPTKRGGTERHTVPSIKRGSVMQAQLKEKGYMEGAITGTPKKPVDVPATIGEISKAYAGIAKYKEEGVVDPGLAAIAAKFDIEVDPATQDKESVDKAIAMLEMQIEKLIGKLSKEDQREVLARITATKDKSTDADRWIRSLAK